MNWLIVKFRYQTIFLLLIMKLGFLFPAESDQTKFKKSNEIVVAKANQTCDAACETVGTYCSFHDYNQFEDQSDINELLDESVEKFFNNSEKHNCDDKRSNSRFLLGRGDITKENRANPLPFLNTSTFCVLRFLRSDTKPNPPCDVKYMERQRRILCSCRMQRPQFEKKNEIIVSGKLESCDDVCSRNKSKCSFDDYQELNEYDVRYLLKKALKSSDLLKNGGNKCTDGSGSIFTKNENYTDPNGGNPPEFSNKTGCIQRYVKNEEHTRINCSAVLNDPEYSLFCSCKIHVTTHKVVTKKTSTIKITPSTKSTTTSSTATTTTTSTTAATTFINPDNATNSSAIAEQKRLNDEYVASATKKMYIVLAVMVVVEVCLIPLVVREIITNRRLVKAEQETIQRKTQAARRKSLARKNSWKKPWQHQRARHLSAK